MVGHQRLKLEGEEVLDQMAMHIDLVNYLESDVALCIMAFLNAPIDIVRASAVSHSWRDFVIRHSLCKKLWLKKVPQFSSIISTVDDSNGVLRLSDLLSTSPASWETLKKEHKIYSSLLQPLAKPIVAPKECISCPIGASSTDQDSDIANTVIPHERYPLGAAYWSSTGQSDPDVPEYLLYRLNSKVCIVTGVHIRPYKAFREPGKPVYSAKSWRFRVGYHRYPRVIKDSDVKDGLNDYEWTYTSPEFHMRQEACWQEFEFPEPVVCVGGIMQIELLGRLQKRESDGLFYIRLGYVRVLGQRLEPAYNMEVSPPGELHLRYYPYALNYVMQRASGKPESSSARKSEPRNIPPVLERRSSPRTDSLEPLIELSFWRSRPVPASELEVLQWEGTYFDEWEEWDAFNM